MLENIKWLGHSTLKFTMDKIIYIDPFNIDKNYNDADLIFITHSHYDHFSINDIKKCMNSNTKIIVTLDLYENTLNIGFKQENVLTVVPNKNYEIMDIKFSTIPAYNPNKNFHPKEKLWVGYLIELNSTIYYIVGDSDVTCEAKDVKCDVLFTPIGGKYTMDFNEAAILTNIVNPKIVIPIHYGSIVGKKEDAIEFKKLLNSNITCDFLIH